MIGEHDDLKELGDGIYYSPHPFCMINSAVIDFLKHAARTKSIRRAGR